MSAPNPRKTSDAKAPSVRNHICPNCGRCDHCGQAPTRYQPYVPYQPWFPWYQPPSPVYISNGTALRVPNITYGTTSAAVPPIYG